MDSTERRREILNYTFSLITQNKYKFYSLTIPIDVLGSTCFITTRYEDPQEGFQRRLDKKRADEIAEYIDSGFGTIPSAVILSAQPEAELTVKPGGRALHFKRHPKAFLVIDGQHRIWGYKLATSHLRVPVIIYQGLSRKEETRLFIDINTKQRPVPSELLLDIKHLADLETSSDTLFRELFDQFRGDSQGVLSGLLSPNERLKGKITRTTFNSAFLTIENIITNKELTEVFPILNAYFWAFHAGMTNLDASEDITNPNVFKAIVAFFPDAASKVKDKFDGDYSPDNFVEVLRPVIQSLSKQALRRNRTSYKKLHELFQSALAKGFSL